MNRNILNGIANIFGSVLPIQKRRWNWLHVSKVKHEAVPDPKRFDTAFRMTTNEIALHVARTSRTVKAAQEKGLIQK